VRPGGIVSRLFSVSRANDVLSVFASLDEALGERPDEPTSE
jgi:hypothetical protein